MFLPALVKLDGSNFKGVAILKFHHEVEALIAIPSQSEKRPHLRFIHDVHYLLRKVWSCSTSKWAILKREEQLRHFGILISIGMQ